jgi:uncharacterized protein YjbI with pentapeptide repeats
MSLSLRDVPPPNYQPPQTIDELIARYEKGERHFANAKLHGAHLKSLHFEHTSFVNADLSGAHVIDCHFEHCVFNDANAAKADIHNGLFQHCDMERLSLRGATLLETTINATRLGNIDVTDANFEALVFRACRDLPTSFVAAKNPGGAQFSNCHLQKVDLRGAKLAGIRFGGSWLTEADFTNADLCGASLVGSDFTDAKFEKTRMDGALVSRAKFVNSTLRKADGLEKVIWDDAELVDCDLSGADLHKALLRGVIARNADFSNCNLQDVNLVDCDVGGAMFKGAKLNRSRWTRTTVNSADFERADLRDARGIEFDQNNLYTAKLSPKGGDKWTELRRQYSGSRLAFHLLILTVFFAPYVIRAAFWTQVNTAQNAQVAALQALQSTPEGRNLLTTAGLVSRGAIDKITSKCLAPTCQEWHVWELLLAADAVWYSQVVAWLLILYNGARLLLTWKVGPLKDDEDRTYVTPALADYKPLSVAHWFVNILFYVSAVSFALHAADILFTESVWLPK